MESDSSIASTSVPEQGNDHATASAHETIDSQPGSAQATVVRVAARPGNRGDAIAGTAAMPVNALDSTGRPTQTTQKGLVSAAGDYVRKHPLTSLGVVIVATLALSRLLSSR